MGLDFFNLNPEDCRIDYKLKPTIWQKLICFLKGKK